MSLQRLQIEQEMRRAEDLVAARETESERTLRELVDGIDKCIRRRVAAGRSALPPWRGGRRRRTARKQQGPRHRRLREEPPHPADDSDTRYP